MARQAAVFEHRCVGRLAGDGKVQLRIRAPAGDRLRHRNAGGQMTGGPSAREEHLHPNSLLTRRAGRVPVYRHHDTDRRQARHET
jgi:hypothetical protein